MGVRGGVFRRGGVPVDGAWAYRLLFGVREGVRQSACALARVCFLALEGRVRTVYGGQYYRAYGGKREERVLVGITPQSGDGVPRRNLGGCGQVLALDGERESRAYGTFPHRVHLLDGYGNLGLVRGE